MICGSVFGIHASVHVVFMVKQISRARESQSPSLFFVVGTLNGFNTASVTELCVNARMMHQI